MSIPVPQPPVADFSGSPTSVSIGNSVQFTDLSLHNPTSWNWTFTGGTPASSSNQNPSITYDTEGIYSVSLTATNNEGSNTKTITDYITVTIGGAGTYCASQSNSNALDWISEVNIGTFSNSSGASLYSDFTSQIIGLVSGSSCNVSLTPFFVGKDQREFWRIWIDYNADGDFDDAGEQVFTANNKKAAVSGTISIPSGLSGQSRMRVSMKNGGAPSSCETFSNGEVEDYTVDFGNGSVAPSKLADFDMNLYPNPANNILNIRLSKNEEIVNIKVYNALGKIVSEFNITGLETRIDLSGFANGMYYIGADNGKNNTLKKFVKN